MDQEIKQNLINFGLSETEAKTYYSALALEEASADQISKYVNINRTTCYPVLDRLKKLGLVGQTKKKGKTIFIACKPQKILDILDERKEGIKKIIPELNSLFEISKGRPGVKFFDGKEGLKTVLNSILNESKEILTFGDGNSFRRSIPGWSDCYSEKRAKKNIKAKILLKATPLAIQVAKEYKKSTTQKAKLTQIRVLPEVNEINCSGFNVYGNKVAMFSYEKQVVAIEIESKIISQMMKVVFNTLWQTAEKYNDTLLKN